MSAVLAELERCRALGIPPDECEIWRLAPDGLRADYLDRLDADDYWRRLRRWLEFFAEAAK